MPMSEVGVAHTMVSPDVSRGRAVKRYFLIVAVQERNRKLDRYYPIQGRFH